MKEFDRIPFLTAMINTMNDGVVHFSIVRLKDCLYRIKYPLFGDQFYWGERAVQLGIGATVQHAAMRDETVSRALGAALDPAVAARARSLARLVRSDGAAVAASQLEVEHGGG